MRPALRGLLLAGALCLGLGACSSNRGGGEVLTVFAASSLKEAAEALAAAYRADHPGAQVALSLAGTQTLRTQLEHGAAADVFMSASSTHMDALRSAGRVHAPRMLTCNHLVIATGATSRVRGLLDLPAAPRIVLGDAAVPIGAYTEMLLSRAARSYGADFPARVRARVVSRELNVRQVLGRVSLGEADAAIVYRTDVAAAGRGLRAVALPADLDVEAHYPIAVVSGRPGAASERAAAFVRLALSPRGQALLARLGFSSCGGG